MKVTVVGCGEAFDGTLPNTSLLVRGPSTVLLDCGFSVPSALWRAGVTGDDIDLIYISHAHADHYFGLAPLLGRMWEDGRKKPVTILSQPAVLEQIEGLLEYGYRTLRKRYNYEIVPRAAEPGEAGGFRFSFAPTAHSVTNWAVRMECGGRTLVYSGDGMFTAESRALCRGADLLVHEAYQMTPSPVHGDIPSVIGMASEENVARLALVHVQRALRASPQPVLEAIQRAPLPVVLPVPGDDFELHP